MTDSMSIKDYVDERDKWIEEYGIGWGQEGGNKVYILEDMTRADHKLVEKLHKKKLIWTNHSTCENEMFTPGHHIFSEDSCCWRTYAFYVANKPWEDEDERIDSTLYLPCPVCNADGEGDGDPDCEGPELPETKYGVELMDDGCEDGYIQLYLD